MYVQAVSTHKVKAIIEQLCGASVSSTQVNRASAQLDEVPQGWRKRSPRIIIHLYLNARYEKVRMDGQIRHVTVLMASGVDLKGKRTILGVSISLNEVRSSLANFPAEPGDQGHVRRAPHHQR
jgi:putative transposase